MLLAINIGNTNINLGLFRGRRLLKKYSIPTKTKNYKVFLKGIIARNKIRDVIISSVMPGATRIIKQDLKTLSGKKPFIIGKDIKVPMKNLYRKPRQLGPDRLVNAYAGAALYGVPLIAIDFGTAVTFDVVGRNKEYLGGMILPGLRMSLDALGAKTALLPRINLKSPQELIGRDTESSILSGIVYGFGAVVDGLIIKLREKVGAGAKVIGTGGDIALIGKYCKGINRIDKDLTLKGLNLIYINQKNP